MQKNRHFQNFKLVVPLKIFVKWSKKLININWKLFAVFGSLTYRTRASRSWFHRYCLWWNIRKALQGRGGKLDPKLLFIYNVEHIIFNLKALHDGREAKKSQLETPKKSECRKLFLVSRSAQKSLRQNLNRSCSRENHFFLQSKVPIIVFLRMSPQGCILSLKYFTYDL